MRKYTVLLFGREKIGKTNWFASWPDILFCTTEPGTKGQNIFEYNHEDGGCKNWKLIRDMVDLLEKTDKFKFVVFDTIDRAYDMCLDYVCSNLGIDYPGADIAGKNDWGKSWKDVKMEFLDIVHRIEQTGRGVGFVSHAREEEFRERGSSESFTRIFPSMSKQCRTIVEAIVDFFFFVDYVRGPGGKVHRVIITQGDEMVWSGSREVQYELPLYLPMTKKGGFDIFQAAFNGEDVGLDPKTLMPTRTAGTTIKKFMISARNKPTTKAISKRRTTKRKGLARKGRR